MTPDQLMHCYEDDTTRQGCGGPVLFVCLLLVLLLYGCKETEYVPVKEVHTEYVHSTDTVHHHDTTRTEKETIIREVNAGDSVLLAQYGIQLRDNERMILFLQRELEKASSQTYEHRTDTVHRTDTIPNPYPVPAQLTAWESAKMKYGGWAIGTVMGAIVIFLMRQRKRFIN